MADTNVGSISYDVRLQLNKLDADISQLKTKLAQVEKQTDKFGGNAAKAGAVAGASMLVLDQAISSVVGSLGDAAKRVDTLNNSNRTFRAMGYETGSVSQMMQQLEADIRGLPTPLDSAIRGVNTLAASTGSLAAGQQGFVAINNAILAFGGSAVQVDNAVLQLSQDFGRGSVQASTFNSLLNSGMQPALNAVAVSMGITMGALKELGSEGGLSAEMLTQKLIELNKDGGGGLESLESMAKSSTGGIQTSFANMNTAITRGLGNLIQGLGASNIGAILTGVGLGIEQVLNTAGNLAGVVGQLLAPFTSLIQIAGSGIGTFALVAGGIFLLQKAFIGARIAMIAFTSHPVIALLSLLAAGAVMAAQAVGMLNAQAGGMDAGAGRLEGELASVNAQIDLLESQSGGASDGMGKAGKAANKLSNDLNKLEKQVAKVWKDFEKQTTDTWAGYISDLKDVQVRHDETIKELTRQIVDENKSYNNEISKRNAAFRKSQSDEVIEHQDKVNSLTNQIQFLQKYNNSYNAQKLAQLKFALQKENELYSKQQGEAQAKLDTELSQEKEARDNRLIELQTELTKENEFQNKHRSDLQSVRSLVKLDEIESLKQRRNEQLASLQQQRDDQLADLAERKANTLASNDSTNAGLLASNADTLAKLKKQRDDLLKQQDEQVKSAGTNQSKNFIDNWNKELVKFKPFKAIDDFFYRLPDDFRRLGGYLEQLGRMTMNGITDLGKGIFNGLLQQIERAVNDPINMLNGISGAIKLPGVKIPKIPTLNLPRLASGGVLATATPFIGGEYPGAKYNPEIVTPQKIMTETFEDVLKRFSPGSQAPIVHITVNGTFATSTDEQRKVADIIMKRFEESQKVKFA